MSLLPRAFHTIVIDRYDMFRQTTADANSVQTDRGDKFNCNYWSDIIHLEGVEVLAHYLKDYYIGYPAVTRHAFGKGSSYYLGTSLERTGLAWLLGRIISEAGIKGVNKIPYGVEVIYRRDGTHRWTFILNYSNESVQVKLIQDGVNLITGALASGSIQLGPRDVAVIQA